MPAAHAQMAHRHFSQVDTSGPMHCRSLEKPQAKLERSPLLLLLPSVNLEGISIQEGSIEHREGRGSFGFRSEPNGPSTLALALEDFSPLAGPSLVTMGFQL